MTHQDKISVLITFVIGVLIGGYLYLTGFATTFLIPSVDEVDVYEQLVITGDSYGECALDNGCLSFQVLGDRSYRAVFDSTGEQRVVSGTISRALWRDITATLDPVVMDRQAMPLPERECSYGAEETNFRFSVSLSGVTYRFDTCTTALEYQSEFWTALKQLWTEIATSPE